jgi:molecular chaperone HscB
MSAGHCWKCEKPAEHNLFCKFCESLQPPVTDYYRFFDLPKKLNLNDAELQKRFYSLSKLLHPDRYTRRPPTEREYSLQATAILNDGYRILRDPIRRAEYILSGAGFENAEQRTKDIPPELLEEVFELNMALEESDKSQLADFEKKFQGMQSDLDKQLTSQFEKWDHDHSGDALSEVRGILNKRKYISNLLNTIHGNLTD